MENISLYTQKKHQHFPPVPLRGNYYPAEHTHRLRKGFFSSSYTILPMKKGRLIHSYFLQEQERKEISRPSNSPVTQWFTEVATHYCRRQKICPCDLVRKRRRVGRSVCRDDWWRRYLIKFKKMNYAPGNWSRQIPPRENWRIFMQGREVLGGGVKGGRGGAGGGILRELRFSIKWLPGAWKGNWLALCTSAICRYGRVEFHSR